MEDPTIRPDVDHESNGACSAVNVDDGPAQHATAVGAVAGIGEPESRALVQPWTAFWPPTIDSDAYRQLKDEYPNVFTCRFDNARPFDRPWRRWGGPAPVEGGGGSLALSKSSHSSFETECRPTQGMPQTDKGMRRDLEETLHELNLPTVQPDSFHHLAPLETYKRDKPYKCHLPMDCFPGFKMHNLASKSYPVSIADVTGHESLFSLEVSGFEFTKWPLTVESWSNDYVVSEYLRDLAEWLKQRLGCRDVLCYAYNFRHHGTSQKSDGRQYDFKSTFVRAHCDASESTCRTRLRLYLPDSYEEAMQGRVRFINVWRPISPAPVEDCPLALCDFRTVDREDLVPVDLVYPHFVDEAYEVKYNPSHRWFYKKGMTQEDVIIFKLYDNSQTEATVCPHSAFVDPSAPHDAPKRASIEVKAILLG